MKIPFAKEESYPEKNIEDQYTELVDTDSTKKMKVMVQKVDGLSSVDKIMRKVREGTIVIASIKELKEANTEELRHCISRMKASCTNLNGDIAGAGDEWVIITPSTAAIYREHSENK